MPTTLLRLPAYPSTQSRKGLSPSQLATLHQNVATTLASVLALPPDKRDIPSTRQFLSSFSKDAAFQALQTLIWVDSQSTTRGSEESLILKRCLMLSEKLALSPPGLDLQTLLDLSIIYARTNPSRLHSVFKAAHQTDPSLPSLISNDLIPGFTALLSQRTPSSHGLYAQRKVSECIYTFLRGAKGIPELIRPFAHDKPFLVALASTYDVGMTSTAASYGGIPALTAGIAAQDRDPDEWEKIWVETKVALLDSFHIVLSALLDDLASCPPGPRLAAQSERTFDVIFAILDAPSSSSSLGLNTNHTTTTPTPFLNQSLLADYQHAYSLSKTLSAALKRAQEKDVRLDLLESTLQSFDSEGQEGAVGNASNKNKNKNKNAGALKILLRSSGIQPGIDNLGTRNHHLRSSAPSPAPSPSPAPKPPPQTSTATAKGKSRAAPPPPDPDPDPELDLKTTQVLDILPDTPVSYVKRLLAHPRYGRDPEKVVGALLEGTAMTEEELGFGEVGDGGGGEGQGVHGDDMKNTTYNVHERKNVFDDEVIDVSQIRFGKKGMGITGDAVLRDRTFIEQMKADILRRAEAISDEEDEDEEGVVEATKGKGKAKTQDPSFSKSTTKTKTVGPDDEDDEDNVRVGGDGEDSGDEFDEDDDEDEGDEEGEGKDTPETLIELAYLRDPKVFERDAATRRSKARVDLRALTGWDDGQIEGWKVMLDRNPTRKDKLQEKHEFRGNEKGLDVRPDGSGGGRARGGGGRGRGVGGARGRGGPRGGGGGGRGAGGGGGNADGAGGADNSAHERAWKDKNKASRGNHNRKRGHDKKMARAGAGVGPSI